VRGEGAQVLPMADVSVIANEIRKYIAEGPTEGVLIALVAHLTDLFPDMTVDQLASALQMATKDRHKPRKPNDSSIG
jgi:hypothetical protein